MTEFLSGETPFLATLNQASENQHWQKRLKDSLSNFTDIFNGLTSNDVGSVVAVLKNLKIEADDELITCLLNSDSDKSAKTRIAFCIETTAVAVQESDGETGILQVMTMHSSKGLSKKLVIVPAFDEKLLPGETGGERLAEIHRLVYVAVTRAKGQVVITFPKTRAKGDPLNYGAKPRLSSYAGILLGTGD